MVKKSNILTYSILISIILIVILGNSATFNLSSGLYKGVPLKITEILISINIVFLIYFKRLNLRKISSLNLLIIWCAFGILSIGINLPFQSYTIKQALYGALYAGRILFYIVYVYYCVNYLKDNKVRFDIVADILIYSYTVVAFIGFIQLSFFPKAYDFYDMLKRLGIYILNPDPHIGRLFSLYLDPNFLSSIIVMGIMLSTAKVIKIGFAAGKKYIFCALVQTIALALTVSRSGVGAIGLSFILFFVFSIKIINKKILIPNFKRIVIFGVILLITLGAVYVLDNSRMFDRIGNIGSDPSAGARLDNWSKTAETIVGTKKNEGRSVNPIYGIGYNMSGFYKNNANEATSFGTDSTLMLIWLTTGIIGLLGYLAYILLTIFHILKRRNEGNFYYGNAIAAILIASVAASFFNNLLFYPLWLFPFLLISNYYILDYDN